MSNNNHINNNQIKAQLEEIAPYVPVVDRVHGGNHPEFHDVRRVFNSLLEKTQAEDSPDLNSEFEELRKITNNFAVPEDVCETFEGIYQTLEAVDQLYNA